jgi:hypothetical protein
VPTGFADQDGEECKTLQVAPCYEDAQCNVQAIRKVPVSTSKVIKAGMLAILTALCINAGCTLAAQADVPYTFAMPLQAAHAMPLLAAAPCIRFSTGECQAYEPPGDWNHEASNKSFRPVFKPKRTYKTNWNEQQMQEYLADKHHQTLNINNTMQALLNAGELRAQALTYAMGLNSRDIVDDLVLPHGVLCWL